MAIATRYRPYGYLAEYYDRILNPGLASIQEATHKAILGNILERAQSACDLACGTGSTALRLAKSGIRTFAVDNSPGMCRRARQKARRAGVDVRVLKADMCSFRLPEQVDLILCEGDAVNHVRSKNDLKRVAHSVATALRPGGWFYMDVNNRKGFRTYWNSTWYVEKPGVVVVMRNANDAAHDRAWSDIEWFLRTGRGVWKRRRERVEEVCWSAGEIRNTFKAAGFDRVRSLDATPYFRNPMIRPGCRTLYLIRKAQ